MANVKSILPRHKKDATAGASTSSKSRKSGSKLGFHQHRTKNGEKKIRPETEKAMTVKNEFVAAVAEFIGTASFLFFAFGGTNVANGGAQAAATDSSSEGVGSITETVDTSKLMYISISFGVSLLVNVWVFFRVSGGLFNPAVSLALCLVKAITPLRCVILTISQILGGITAAALIYGLTPGQLNVRTTLATGMSTAQGLFLEMFLTALLVTTILLLAVEKHRSTYLAPVGIGLALFIAELTGVSYTGGSLNPSRSFGPEVVGKQFVNYHWIYWLGPYLGAILSVGLYKFLNYMDYETVNPDQDATFEGQAPIHVKMNDNGRMELDETMHETTTDPAAHVEEKVQRAIRQPSAETIATMNSQDRAQYNSQYTNADDQPNLGRPVSPSRV